MEISKEDALDLCQTVARQLYLKWDGNRRKGATSFHTKADLLGYAWLAYCGLSDADRRPRDGYDARSWLLRALRWRTIDEVRLADRAYRRERRDGYGRGRVASVESAALAGDGALRVSYDVLDPTGRWDRCELVREGTLWCSRRSQAIAHAVYCEGVTVATLGEWLGRSRDALWLVLRTEIRPAIVDRLVRQAAILGLPDPRPDGWAEREHLCVRYAQDLDPEIHDGEEEDAEEEGRRWTCREAARLWGCEGADHVPLQSHLARRAEGGG